jgi:hypothetical protein
MRKLVILCALVLSCAKRESAPNASQAERPVHVGEPLKLDDSTWTVIEAKDLGKSIRANTNVADPKDTSGHFVLVRYKIMNRHKSPESVLDPPKVLDDQSRESERMSMEALYVPTSAQTLGMEPLPPNVEKEFASIFELPADAKGLKLQIRGLGLLGAKRSVDLGL